MPAEKKPVQVEQTSAGHFIDYEGTKIQLPRPLEQMTQEDWMHMAASPKSSLRQVTINNENFHGLRVVLKDKNYIPIWLNASGLRHDKTPQAFDQMIRARSNGCELVTTLDDLDESSQKHYSINGADGTIRVDDVVLAKIFVVKYYKMHQESIDRSRVAIEANSVEGKAYDGVDVPKYVKGSREVPTYEATEHSVQYQDRPRF